jgi:hypothetical protein
LFGARAMTERPQVVETEPAMAAKLIGSFSHLLNKVILVLWDLYFYRLRNQKPIGEHSYYQNSSNHAQG